MFFRPFICFRCVTPYCCCCESDGDYVCLELRPVTDPLSSLQIIHEWMSNSGGMILTGEPKDSVKDQSQYHGLQKVLRWLTWARTWASSDRSEQLIPWGSYVVHRRSHTVCKMWIFSFSFYHMQYTMSTLQSIPVLQFRCIEFKAV
jgi:hypothetical protein